VTNGDLAITCEKHSYGTFVDEPPSIAQGGKGVVVPASGQIKNGGNSGARWKVLSAFEKNLYTRGFSRGDAAGLVEGVGVTISQFDDVLALVSDTTLLPRSQSQGSDRPSLCHVPQTVLCGPPQAG
jgi:hypothetical protein